MCPDFGKLDHDSFIPLYYQLKQILLEKIETNEWELNQVIPSEHHLQEIFNVSRATVRRTVNSWPTRVSWKRKGVKAPS